MSIPLHVVETIESTSETLKRRADAGTPEHALLAATQTGGRGRLGRIWVSPPGNLHLSVLLRPEAPVIPGHWSLLAAVATAAATAAFMPDPTPLRLKWPNDLMLGNAKLGGILLDAGASPDSWLVIGIGLNLAAAPPGLGRPTASLAPHAPTPHALAHALLHHLDQWRHRYRTEGFTPIRSHWEALGPPPGTPLTLAHAPSASSHAPLRGTYQGIAPDGALLLHQPDGTLLPIRSGEIE